MRNSVWNDGASCRLHAQYDGTISYVNPAPTAIMAVTCPSPNTWSGGLTLRPIDSLRINADFQFGFNNKAYTQIFFPQFKSYKVHTTYKPNRWATIDGANPTFTKSRQRPNINAIEHGRDLQFGTTLAPNSNFAFSVGYNYTDLYIAVADLRQGSGLASALWTLPLLSVNDGDHIGRNVVFTATSSITLMRRHVDAGEAHYRQPGLFREPLPEATLVSESAYIGRHPGVQLSKTLYALTVNLDKGLSYKTTWNYYDTISRHL